MRGKLHPAERIIIALDFDSKEKAVSMARELAPTGVRFKIGMELFYACGPSIVEEVRKQGEVFVDLKLHDIPNTMSQAAQVLTKLGAWMFNVHASAGAAALERVYDDVGELCAKNNLSKPNIIGVTVLTSLANLSHLGTGESARASALRLARLSAVSHLDGVVCSAKEVAALKSDLKKNYPDFLYVTPGIRLAENTVTKDDQNRTCTPGEAIDNGATHLVIGRPVTGDRSPVRVVEKIAQELAKREGT